MGEKERFKGIKPNSGLTHALKYAAYVLRQSIGVSKHEIYKLYGGKTPYIHLYSIFNCYMGIAKEFVNWAKERGINRLDKVQYEHVKSYLLEKAERGLSKKTLKVNMTALRKFFGVVGRGDIAKQIERDYVEPFSSWYLVNDW